MLPTRTSNMDTQSHHGNHRTPARRGRHSVTDRRTSEEPQENLRRTSVRRGFHPELNSTLQTIVWRQPGGGEHPQPQGDLLQAQMNVEEPEDGPVHRKTPTDDPQQVQPERHTLGFGPAPGSTSAGWNALNDLRGDQGELALTQVHAGKEAEAAHQRRRAEKQPTRTHGHVHAAHRAASSQCVCHRPHPRGGGPSTRPHPRGCVFHLTTPTAVTPGS